MTHSAHSRAAVLVGAVVLTAALAACGHSAPTRMFVLEPVPPAVRAPLAYAGPPLQVDTVRVPAVLDRLEMVRAVGPGEFRIQELDHWAGPLGRIARQALAQNLAARMPPGAVVFGDPPKEPTVKLQVEILSFRLESGEAVMQVSWTRSLAGTDAAPAAIAVLRCPVTALDSPATAAAISELLGELADRIVREL